MKKIIIINVSEICLEVGEEFPSGVEEQLKDLLDSGEEINPFKISPEYKDAFNWIIENIDRGTENYSISDIIY